jgi:hypothetical protein
MPIDWLKAAQRIAERQVALGKTRQALIAAARAGGVFEGCNRTKRLGIANGIVVVTLWHAPHKFDEVSMIGCRVIAEVARRRDHKPIALLPQQHANASIRRHSAQDNTLQRV